MYAITGITGKVGGELARTLLAQGQPVRAVVRDESKGDAWAELGCQVAIAEMESAAALTRAFTGATAAFILPPSEFDPEPGYPEAQRVISNVVSALKSAEPGRVVCLSTIGADAIKDNLLSQRTMMEDAITKVGLPLTILRPGWFIENALLDVTSARDAGIIQSFLQPADRPFPMVATRDVGRVAAELIQEGWSGKRIVELEGPRRISPNDLAMSFGRALAKVVRVQSVPRDTWETLFRSQGMKNPQPRISMLDGFNEGWIEFKERGAEAIKGRIDADAVIAGLLSTDRRDEILKA
ncbi:NAD(P)H-binding protein [Bradyrhizobium sp. AUGA SZCCT0240]|nr:MULTISPECIES: NAD(P)H-binding protein [unclassified Bradyrhizobium]MBR1194187.1 NAD(P)H-binding protein [Bradyrhizobium sp. AUGA SZCCT0160]MBR1195721.1 NAD(P)H-binding protein [Bradyrhizobium sp. AUGA SZCCT0158]MBR1243485.1 NAD(P)H-binding protein [Bradyrhizobium sp. AUGA SZCCT0274]MBR1258381.1 NAD(P)H-binding protein [Bradyrhizobium sp. AUGA SZCCT0240]